jgi:hypothetical protein
MADIQSKSNSALLRFLTNHFRPKHEVLNNEPAQDDRMAVATWKVVIQPAIGFGPLAIRSEPVHKSDQSGWFDNRRRAHRRAV